MDVVLLVKSGIGLLVILAILMVVMIGKPKSKNKKFKSKPLKSKEKVYSDLKHLRSIIKNKKSSTKELQEALDLVLKYHGTIHPKLGMRAHPDFDIYMEILMAICRHPNTTKDVIIKFDIALEKRNPEYKAEINNALTKGLNSRGF